MIGDLETKEGDATNKGKINEYRVKVRPPVREAALQVPRP